MAIIKLLGLLNMVFNLVSLCIFIGAFFSWIPGFNPYNNKITGFIYKVSEIVLEPIRNMLKSIGVYGVLDISPIIAIFLIEVAKKLLFRIIVFF